MAALALLQAAGSATQTATVAVTLSSISVIGVGTLIFKAGEWRGEHRALQQRVSEGYKQLEKRMDEQFSLLRQDVRDIRDAE